MAKTSMSDAERQAWIDRRRHAAAESAIYASELRIHDVSFVPKDETPYKIAEGE